MFAAKMIAISVALALSTAPALARGKSSPQVSEMTVTKKMDKSSPKLLYGHAATGKHLPKAKLQVR
jgi:type VI protein secretion system component Hcp